MIHLQAWQWILGGIAAAGIGISKTGVPGIGILSVALFAIILPTRMSVGVVLPVLVAGDIVAVLSYRRHAVWSHLWRLFPWAALGIVLGYLALGRISSAQVGHLIGGILILLVGVQAWRRWGRAPSVDNDDAAESESQRRLNLLFALAMGIMAGFTTMVANAAGPIMILYLLSMRLPKMEFIGTAAWYCMVLNWFKIPFSVNLGLVNVHSLLADLVFAPCCIAGALFGKSVLKRFDQDSFELVALFFTLLAAVRLVTG